MPALTIPKRRARWLREQSQGVLAAICKVSSATDVSLRHPGVVSRAGAAVLGVGLQVEVVPSRSQDASILQCR